MLNHFKNFKKYAFRLELLQEYNIPNERKHFIKFLKTKIYTPSTNSEWIKLIKSANKRKAKISRVHVIELPLSDYLKFEIRYYKINKNAGEQVFLLNKDKFKKIKPNIKSDFWLFDDEIVLKMKYDKQGRFLGYKEIKRDIQKYIDLKNKLLKIAKKK
ncbi:MAG: hypothetical protein PHE43_03070 [Candidatus Nanoarchaeia archaeon]|nr:hypothetical protein [Candidatus Nanoarchaeia archaeon]